MATAPAGALLVVLFGWALGSLTGGFLAGRVSPKAPRAHGLVVGGLITVAAVANNLMIPPPTWFWIAGLVVCLPASYAGARLVPQRMAPPPAGASAGNPNNRA